MILSQGRGLDSKLGSKSGCGKLAICKTRGVERQKTQAIVPMLWKSAALKTSPRVSAEMSCSTWTLFGREPHGCRIEQRVVLFGSRKAMGRLIGACKSNGNSGFSLWYSWMSDMVERKMGRSGEFREPSGAKRGPTVLNSDFSVI